MSLLDPLYTLKAIKTFQGMEGYGFNANLYKGKRKIAELIDDASGGELRVHWEDYDQPKIKGETMVAFNGLFEREMTPEEAELSQYLLDQDMADTTDADMSIWLDEQVNITQLARDARKLLKKATLSHPDKPEVFQFGAAYEGNEDYFDELFAKDYPDHILVNKLDADDVIKALNYHYFKSREDNAKLFKEMDDKKANSTPGS